MADRFDDRYRGGSSDRDRYRGREERNFMERAGDEVRSWFGDDDASRRRERDEWRERERYGDRGRDRDYGRYEGRDQGYGRSERGYAGSDPGWSRRGGYAPEEDWRGGSPAGEPYLGGSSMGTDRGFGVPSVRSYATERYGSYGSGSGSSYADDFSRGARQYDASGGESWRRQESYTGRGPKGYQRSDDRIREDVCDRLADDPRLDASEIEISVSQGEVTLSGSVRERDDKRRAEDLIESISGVREVHNTLRVNRGDTGTPGSVLGLGPNNAATPPGQSEIRGTTSTGRSSDFGSRK